MEEEDAGASRLISVLRRVREVMRGTLETTTIGILAGDPSTALALETDAPEPASSEALMYYI